MFAWAEDEIFLPGLKNFLVFSLIKVSWLLYVSWLSVFHTILRTFLSFLAILKLFLNEETFMVKTTWLLIFIPAKQFCLLINESPAKLCPWQGRQPGYTPIVKTVERTRICGSFLLTLTWGFMGLRSLAKAKLLVLFENILNIFDHNGFAVTIWNCEQQRSPEEARTVLKWQIKKRICYVDTHFCNRY